MDAPSAAYGLHNKTPGDSTRASTSSSWWRWLLLWCWVLPISFPAAKNRLSKPAQAFYQGYLHWNCWNLWFVGTNKQKNAGQSQQNQVRNIACRNCEWRRTFILKWRPTSTDWMPHWNCSGLLKVEHKEALSAVHIANSSWGKSWNNIQQCTMMTGGKRFCRVLMSIEYTENQNYDSTCSISHVSDLKYHIPDL